MLKIRRKCGGNEAKNVEAKLLKYEIEISNFQVKIFEIKIEVFVKLNVQNVKNQLNL